MGSNLPRAATMQTTIKFFGVLPAAYPGAARAGCPPTDPKAVGWHAVVGGTSVVINGVEDFAKHFYTFLQYAYEAGREDARNEMRERLGL